MPALASKKRERTTAELAAWREYLDATKPCDHIRYPEVEAWAWARLQRRLKAS